MNDIVVEFYYLFS